jgi:hypothetical protein
MKDFGIALDLRFNTKIGGHLFVGEVDCPNLEAATATCRDLLSDDNVTLVAAQVLISTVRDGGCDILDDASNKIFQDLCKTLQVHLETFWNMKLGWYDHLNNRIEPADMGQHFPDGSLRIVWEEESAALTLDDSIRILKGATELLVEMQELPHFCATEEEFEVGTDEPAINRRIDVLFAAGCWPDEDSCFDEEAFEKRATVLEPYAPAVAGQPT